MKTKNRLKIIVSFMLVLVITSSLSLFIGTFSSAKTCIDTRSIEELHTSGSTTYDDEPWVVNPTFIEPVDPWYPTIEEDVSDASTSTSPNQANAIIIGESYEEEVLLSSATFSKWEAFNKSEFALEPQRTDVAGPYYGINSDGAWCTHRWREQDTGGQPKNTPEMHWRTNVSLPVDMSDYIITSVDFNAVINASVDPSIDTPGDIESRTGGPLIDQSEKYDFAQFYVEITTLDIDVLNIYPIAFNQTRLLGNESLSLYDIEGLIGAYGEQAIIDALTIVKDINF